MTTESESILPPLVSAYPNAPRSIPTTYLSQEYLRWQMLFAVQSMSTQQFIQAEAERISQFIFQPSARLRFSLPHQIRSADETADWIIPARQRIVQTGSLFKRLDQAGASRSICLQLTKISSLENHALAVAAGLLRFSIAHAIIYQLLPAGQVDGPQWAVFDDQDQLLVNSRADAEACLAELKQYILVLQSAAELAPYMVVDLAYQQKRSGLFSQIVNQGQSYARYRTREIIHTIQHRAAANSLNRGLSVDLPYFDDQTLDIHSKSIEMIPPSRVMFVPAFVVVAVRKALTQLDKEISLSQSTRKHLQSLLRMVETAFLPGSQNR